LRSRDHAIQSQDLDIGRGDKDLAERVHPARSLVARADALMTQIIELIKVRQLDLEL
jgi:hypothetical protein